MCSPSLCRKFLLQKFEIRLGLDLIQGPCRELNHYEGSHRSVFLPLGSLSAFYLAVSEQLSWIVLFSSQLMSVSLLLTFKLIAFDLSLGLNLNGLAVKIWTVSHKQCRILWSWDCLLWLQAKFWPISRKWAAIWGRDRSHRGHRPEEPKHLLF